MIMPTRMTIKKMILKNNGIDILGKLYKTSF